MRCEYASPDGKPPRLKVLDEIINICDGGLLFWGSGDAIDINIAFTYVCLLLLVGRSAVTL